MKREIIKVVSWTAGVFVILSICYTLMLEKKAVDAEEQNSLVLLNEIYQLTLDAEGNNPAQDAIDSLRNQLSLSSGDGRRTDIRQLAAGYLSFAALYLLAVFFYLYVRILKPFYRLEEYAGRVAKGDMDFSLKYERRNFFGAFTWAFDHMREEIRLARKNEERAVRENKTIIAALSHDIKTPIASIRAYAEGLQAGLEADYGQRERYLSVIMKKCDEVTRLTNDLVLHSLSELDSLEIKKEKIHIRQALEETLKDLEYPGVVLRRPAPDAELAADGKRLAQVLENVLGNARKYAPGGEITVWAETDVRQGRYLIHVRDQGDGILPEDMPFVFDKFYRGKNAGQQPGSGLGLYIVKYIMERMQGGVALQNHSDGMEVTLWLPLNETAG